MATPKASGLPQHSFFHTPVPLSPLAAMVTASGQPASNSVYVPQRKLDVSAEDSWCLGQLFRGRALIVILVSLRFLLPLNISQRPGGLLLSVIKIATKQILAEAQRTYGKPIRNRFGYPGTLPPCCMWCWLRRASGPNYGKLSKITGIKSKYYENKVTQVYFGITTTLFSYEFIFVVL